MKVRYLFFLLGDQGPQCIALGLFSIEGFLGFRLSEIHVRYRLDHQVQMGFKIVEDALIEKTLAGQDSTVC
jgi:hypothetical protein